MITRPCMIDCTTWYSTVQGCGDVGKKSSDLKPRTIHPRVHHPHSSSSFVGCVHQFVRVDKNTFTMDLPIVFTADEMLEHGLLAIGSKHKGNEDLSCKWKVLRFIASFGCKPLVASQIWLDLQTRDVPKAYINAEDHNINYFLMSLIF